MYNDMHRHILSVIDVFSKFLHLVPLQKKSGPSVASAFHSIFQDDNTRSPVWVRTDKSIGFLNKQFQYILHDLGIQYQA